MLRRSFLQALPTVTWAAQRAAARPNILYVLADDLGSGDLGCYNPESKIPTPNLDRLASQGIRFTDMHSPSSVCTPTRYGILTGRYCWRSPLKSGVLNGYSPNLIESGRPTVASLLKNEGYSTAAFGKWHLGLGAAAKTDYFKPLRPSPIDHGFETFYGIPASLDMPPYIWVDNDHAAEPPTAETPGDTGLGGAQGRFYRAGAMSPSFRIDEVLPTITRKTEEFLRARRVAANPFFLYVPLTAPHTPWAPIKEYHGKSRAGLYGDFVSQVDDSVGRIVAALEQSGQAHNTLVLFASDNGAYWKPANIEATGHRANANWRGMKADIYEGGHHIPFLARWPGRVAAGAVSSQLGCLTDLCATAAEVAGVTLPRDSAEDSFSLAPALFGTKPKTAVRDVVIHHSSQGLFAVRRGPWKLALGRGSGGFTQPAAITPKEGEPEGELYNIAEDPQETRNLWADKPDIVKSLTALLEQYRSDGRSRPVLTR
ncbi:arylsulfatase [uncultured Paludibaculum sp.]|uniref:sulfatase family protein n=1 Tax=uncultured Paludibaculum sp. TaxID=1765020 RepID=UPI002AAC3A1D|nr:arylsulfatase [uncultured Paludibaculum sp.]